MFKVIAAPALALAALGVTSIALAADPAATPQKAPAAAPSPGPASALELTPAQRGKAETLRAESERQLAPLREQLAAKRQELTTLWTAEKPDRSAILKKETELDGLRQKMRQVLLDQRLAYLALLTPEQRSAWRSRAASGRGGPGMAGHGMGNMHGGMAGHGMGNMHGGMAGHGMGSMHGGPPLDAMGAEDCMGFMDCDAACLSAPPPAPPAATRPSKPAGPPAGSR